MIIILLGGVGSGKTLGITRAIKQSDNYAIANFPLNFPKEKYMRIKVSDIIIKPDPDKKGESKPKDWRINWGFWDKLRERKPNFSIYLDEVHNLIHSRASMSKTNILLSKWVSQIRKILSDSATNHLYLCSQTVSKIDKDFRDLAHIFILHKKYQIKGKVWIKQKFYEDIEMVGYRPIATKIFYGNPYFKYYDYLKMVKFGDADDYL